MENNYIMLNLDDEKSAKIAEVMANKTCKKILSLLAEEELSETDIARKLNLAINTAEYNIKKLVEAGLIEKAEKHFWSVKGKKIPVYKLSNKYIVIAPKKSSKMMKTFLPVVLLTGFAALIVRYFSLKQFGSKLTETTSSKLIESAPQVSETINTINYSSNILDKILNLQSWEWFLIGALFAIILLLILNYGRLNK